LLVEPDSPDQLAEAMIAIYDQPDFRRRVGECGRRRVESEFDIRIVAQRYEEIYLSLLRKKRPSALNGSADGACSRASQPAFESRSR
jgi:colanic acid biosynthesis glycosyl transferase WcaI